jgi:hypothetical protein
MISAGRGSPRMLLLGGYVLGVFLIVAPIVTLMSGVYPFVFSASTWRFATYGLAMEAAIVPLIGVFVLSVTAAAAGHRLMGHITMVLLVLIAVTGAATTALFALDAMQVRTNIRPEIRSKWDITTLRTMAVGVFYVATLLFLAYGNRKAARSRASSHQPATVHAPSRIVALAQS